jgi:hypothetical protein
MKKEKFTKWLNGTRRPIIACLAALLAGACVWDDNDDTRPGDLPGEETLVTFSLSVPGGTPASRALSKADEDNVSQVDVLLFDEADKFYYRATGSHIVDDDTALPTVKKKFDVKLPQGTFHVVVLANAAAVLAAAPPLVKGTSRQATLDPLEVSLATGKWEAAAIPMWGYKPSVTINASTITITDFPVTRAMARVDVNTTPAATGAANSNFALQRVYLYNRYTNGTLVPGVSGTGYDASKWQLQPVEKAKAPRLAATPVRALAPSSTACTRASGTLMGTPPATTTS